MNEQHWLDRSYEEWLSRARVFAAFIIATVVAIAFALFVPSMRAMATSIGYSTGIVVAIARGGNTIFLPIRGRITYPVAAFMGLSHGVVAGVVYIFVLYASPGFHRSTVSHYSVAGLSLALIYGLVLAPIFETIVVQGWLQTRLMDAFGLRVGIVLTVIAFALAHGNTALFILLPSCILAYLRVRYGSLLAAAVAHATVNAIVEFAIITVT